jgi:hypothetical protein
MLLPDLTPPIHGLEKGNIHHRTRPGGLICYPTHDDVPMATNGDDIYIHTTTEMEKYKSLCHREFAHTDIYNVNLLEGVRLDEELPTILRTIG